MNNVTLLVISFTTLTFCGLATAGSVVKVVNDSNQSIKLLGRDKTISQHTNQTLSTGTALSGKISKHHALIIYDTHKACNYLEMNPGITTKKLWMANGWYLKVVSNNKTVGKVCAIKETILDPNTRAELKVQRSGKHYTFDLKNTTDKNMESINKNVTFDLKGTF